MENRRNFSVGLALVPIITMIALIYISLQILQQGVHIALFLSTVVAASIALKAGYKWKEIEEYMIDSISSSMSAILILIIIGMIIGTWILSGIVPTMIVYGLKLISPKVFLLATLIICSVVSISTGSSWTTAGTVGIALIGIGDSMGIPLPMVAGAIISGAYFGDKMSPLSDTTNLAPAMAGADLFDHIRHMIYTTGPSFLIAGIIYGILGLKFGGNSVDASQVNAIISGIESTFVISPVLLLAPLLIIVMVIKKVPAIPGLVGGVFLASLMAIAVQGTDLSSVFSAAYRGFSSETGIQAVDKLLSRGGLMDMWYTISLVTFALCFGGIMDRSGMLEVLANKILSSAQNTGSLILATLLTAIATNLFVGSQYMAIVIPGRMYAKAYEAKGLHPKNLSRCLEDAGTLTSALIPWNSGGAFMAATLGVSPLAYAPFAFINLINPVISAIYGYTGFTIEYLDESKEMKKTA